ncbi:hypothetical protein [Nitratireductor sp. ZSWI3]|uniref:hypothetical protein n=1 Tax=Nitratireductor sp. ZSWI3 TaxID=2966359 RepID=UPI00214FBBA8|nr:hypothetical protein [Nitratireductor sp. ZSWI3]MCR4265784.1 hypothetical protein [Nitratireductor sp. ZSWI3]
MVRFITPFSPESEKVAPASTGRDGFSLVDMLVALLLLATIAGLTMSFYNQLRTLKRIESVAADQMEMDALSSFLEETIRKAMPLPLLQSAEADQHFLIGTPTSILLVGLSRQGTRAIGLRELTFVLRGDRQNMILVQESRPRRLAEASRNSFASSINLTDGVRSIRFEYMAYDPVTYDPVWSDTWTSARTLPEAVRFQMLVERNGETIAVTGYTDLLLSQGWSLPATAQR